MTFELWCQKRGLDAAKMDADTVATMRKIYDMEQQAVREAAEGASRSAGTPAPAPAAQNPQERMNLILGTARAATATATSEVRAQVLDLATELVGKADVTAEAAQRQIQERLIALAKKPSEPGTSPDQREGFVAPRDPQSILSKREIEAAFGEARADRTAYRHAARSLVNHIEHGNAIPSEELMRALEGKQGHLVVHSDIGRPSRRTILAGAVNVATQETLNVLLNKAYAENLGKTDALVTIIPGGAEFSLPEVEAEDSVKRIKEGGEYPLIGTTDRDVKTGHVKYGGAIAQTRENSVFDRLGRVMVGMQSIARQLRRYRDDFRLARICDSTAMDGRYIGRPGNDSGTAAFYSGTADHRGNANLVTSNGLADETDIDAVVQRLEGFKLLDGTHIMPSLRVILVPSGLKATAWKILNSLYAPSAVAATGQPNMVNPYGPTGMLSEVPTIISHPKVSTYAGASTTWFAGDPKQQFFEVEHWPIEMVPVIASGDMALRDVVAAWKGSFCIDLVALSNMFFVKCTA